MGKLSKSIILFLVLFGLALSGCNILPSDAMDQLPLEQTADPVFSPSDGTVGSSPMTIELSTSTPNAYIFYVKNEAFPDFDAWMNAINALNLQSVESCKVLFDWFNETLPDINETIIKEIGYGQYVGELTEDEVNSCMAIVGELERLSNSDQAQLFDYVSNLEDKDLEPCITILEYLNNSEDFNEDLDKWLKELDYYETELDECNAVIETLKDGEIYEDLRDMLYNEDDKIVLTQDATIQAIAVHKDAEMWPSELVAASYKVTGGNPECTDGDTTCGNDRYCENNVCQDCAPFTCTIKSGDACTIIYEKDANECTIGCSEECGNRQPTVSITSPAPNTHFAFGTPVNLVANSNDFDGDTLSYSWTKSAGTGTVTFVNANAEDTTATFGSAGVYTLRLRVNDTGGLFASDTVTIHIDEVPNNAPFVNITSPVSGTAFDYGSAVVLNATATDADNDALTFKWYKTSGEGAVTFTSATSKDTTATFSLAGAYTLRLNASDAKNISFDTVSVTIKDEQGNAAPTIEWISPQVYTFEVNTDIVVSVLANDTDGQITLIDIRVDGKSLNSTSVNPNGLFSTTWTPTQEGIYTLSAFVQDDNDPDKATTYAPNLTINITDSQIIYADPEIEIISPEPDTIYYVGDQVVVGALVQYAGPINSVEFFLMHDNENESIDFLTGNSSNYTTIIDGQSQGVYRVFAKIETELNGVAYSDPVRFVIVGHNVALISDPGWIVYEGNSTNVTCLSTVDRYELTLTRNGEQVAKGTGSSVSDYAQLSNGTYVYECVSEIGEKTSRVLNIKKDRKRWIITFNTEEFDENSTNFSRYNDTELLNLSNVTFSNPFGEIKYLENIKIQSDIDLVDKIFLRKNRAQVKSEDVEEFDKKAKITFRNVNLENPVVFKRDGTELSICSQTQCFNAEYDKAEKIYSFEVSGFSEYTLNETPECGDNICVQGVETCSSCEIDCGACPNTRSSSRRSNSVSWCTPSWECGDWNECREDGYQIRECIDKWDCGSTKDMPILYQQCGPIKSLYITPTKENPQNFPDNTGSNNQAPPPNNNNGGTNPDPDPAPNKDPNAGSANKQDADSSSFPWVYVIVVVLIAAAVGVFFFLKSRGKGESHTSYDEKITASGTQNATDEQSTQHNQKPALSDSSLKKCKDYINSMRTQGLSDSEIKTKMKTAGWTDKQLDYVLSKM